MQSSEATSGSPARGRLKVFLGYAAGVGKTYQMLDEGRRRHERGQDVVIGALQPEVPPEVQPLVGSLEVIPTRNIGGVPVMNVPVILQRRPQICLVDGLAYDNPRGSRHAHRWQDVEELLAAGITVVASVNLHHIDDQLDAVERLTGQRATQTIPREFLNTADEIVVVDAPTEGAPAWLSELRERALVLSADVLEASLQRYVQATGTEPLPSTHERFLVCLTPDAGIERMMASARAGADRFHCEVLALYVKLPGVAEHHREEMEQMLARARAAGACVDVVEGADPIEQIVRYARTHGITQIFVGQGPRRGWRARLLGSTVSRLVRAARGMDVRVFPPEGQTG